MTETLMRHVPMRTTQGVVEAVIETCCVVPAKTRSPYLEITDYWADGDLYREVNRLHTEQPPRFRKGQKLRLKVQKVRTRTGLPFYLHIWSDRR